MNQPIKILIYVPIWQRPEITRANFENVERLMMFDKSRYQIEPFFVVSEDWAKDLCIEFGFDFCTAENRPLGRKLNAGLFDIFKSGRAFDWLLTLGSDDFIEPSFLDEYLPYFETRKMFGLKTVCMVNQHNGMAKLCTVDQGCWGALRAIRWDVLEAASFDGDRFLGIWTDSANRGMDYTSSINIFDRTGIFVYPVEIETKLFDLKTDVNINPFHGIEGTVVRVLLPEIPREMHQFLPNANPN